MSLQNTNNEEYDIHSISSSTNSDNDDNDEFNYHTHRSCSRHKSCNGKKHQHSSIDSNKFKFVKGDIRSVDNEPGHQQKYDGTKWRRVCSVPDCLRYLNGGAFYENWLCGKHYLLYMATDAETNIPANETSQKPSTRRCNKGIKLPQRGDIMTDADNIRQKYNGKSWRPICNYNNCKCFIVARGYCRRHDTQIRKKKSKIVRSLLSVVAQSPSPILESPIKKLKKDNIQQRNPVSESHMTQSLVSPIKNLKRGDIQCVRQQWNGTKWYSLCHYHTQNCTRRSGGIRCANLCDKHFKEYTREKKNPTNRSNSLSPIVKRKRSINNEYQCQSTTDQIQQIEQYIQTDLTYPLETKDLRQGCFLIEDDVDDQYHPEPSQLMVYTKKEEEENYLTNKRKLAFNSNSLPMNCKIEITKLEF